MNACVKEVDFLQMQDYLYMAEMMKNKGCKCEWLNVHVGWKCGCNDEV